VKYAFILQHRKLWPVAAQCRVLEVSASGYRQYRARQTDIGPLQPGRRLGDVALLVHIKAVFSEMKSAYGWPRIWRELQARGIRAGKERVRKLMKAHGLRARGKRKFKATTNSGLVAWMGLGFILRCVSADGCRDYFGGCRAVQISFQRSPSHFPSEMPGNQLARLRRGTSQSWKLDDMV
jgi:hypothetical protein